MSIIKACIFDLDGVIVDTAVYHYKAWKRLANELGFEITEEDNEKLKGVSRTRSLELILQWGGISKTDAEKEELAERKNRWYVEMISRMTPDEVLPGAKEFLESCISAGIKTALGSASKNSGMILHNTKIAHLFNVVIDGNKVSKPKPDPEVFLKGAEELNEPPENCVVFEDAIAGVEAAIAGGMKVVGVGSAQALGMANLVINGLNEMSLEKLYELNSPESKFR
jgi:beta-phosphoglucomutase